MIAEQLIISLIMIWVAGIAMGAALGAAIVVRITIKLLGKNKNNKKYVE